MTSETQMRHSDMVRALGKSGLDIARQMTADEAHMLHMAVGISGEAGELLDAVKKHVIYKKPLDRENVIEELGDLQFYIRGILNALGVTLDQTLQHNMEKLARRYPNYKYTDERAQERADKQ